MAEPSKTIVIAGAPRSGTTLLLDIMASSLRYRKIFEPLHPKNVPGADSFFYLYIRPDEKNSQLESFMRKALIGKINTPWTNELGIVKDAKSFFKMLTKLYRWRWWAPDKMMKIIRGNLMLGWLEKNFGCKIVFIVRHPCAVVESQKRMRWEKGREMEFDRVISQKNLFEDYLAPFESEIKKIEGHGDYWKKAALLWAIENMVPLKQIKTGTLHALPIFYENILMNPEKEFQKISKYTGITEIDIEKLIKPSRTADKKTFSSSKEKMLSKWKNRLSEEQIEEILNTVNSVGASYYNEDLMPIIII